MMRSFSPPPGWTSRIFEHSSRQRRQYVHDDVDRLASECVVGRCGRSPRTIRGRCGLAAARFRGSRAAADRGRGGRGRCGGRHRRAEGHRSRARPGRGRAHRRAERERRGRAVRRARSHAHRAVAPRALGRARRAEHSGTGGQGRPLSRRASMRGRTACTSSRTGHRQRWRRGIATCASTRTGPSFPRRATTARSACCDWGGARPLLVRFVRSPRVISRVTGDRRQRRCSTGSRTRVRGPMRLFSAESSWHASRARRGEKASVS
jgi:uncharacterized low-complexity protein